MVGFGCSLTIIKSLEDPPLCIPIYCRITQIFILEKQDIKTGFSQMSVD